MSHDHKPVRRESHVGINWNSVDSGSPRDAMGTAVSWSGAYPRPCDMWPRIRAGERAGLSNGFMHGLPRSATE